MIAPDWNDPNINLGPWNGDYAPGPMHGHVEVHYQGDGSMFGGDPDAGLIGPWSVLCVACLLCVAWLQVKRPGWQLFHFKQ